MKFLCWHDWTKWQSYCSALGMTRQRRKCVKCDYETDSFVCGDHDPTQAARERKQQTKAATP